MVLKIISFICTVLFFLALGAFVSFVVFKLRKIDSQTDSTRKHHWGMDIYMNDIPQTEQNTKRLSIVPLKIYGKNEYSNLPIPHLGVEINGVYYSGEDCFILKGIVNNVSYNINKNWIIVDCSCTDICRI